MADGIRWVRDEVAKSETHPLLRVPDVILRRGDGLVAYSPGRNALMVDVGELIEASRQDFSAIQTIAESPEAVPVFEGTMRDYFTTIGVHETDHARWVQQNGAENVRIVSAGISLNHYTSPHELEAIQAELRVAIDRRMPEITVKALQHKVQTVMMIIGEQKRARPRESLFRRFLNKCRS